MTSKYKLIPADTFQTLQMDAGVLVSSFDIDNKQVKASDVLCATTGGLNFTDTPTYTDFGEDIDNCPTNMMELKHLDSHEVKMSGTALTVTPTFAAKLAGAADAKTASGVSTITPRNSLDSATDFQDLWWVGDYGVDGFVAIHLLNALNTSGFALQTTNNGKGQFAFEFTGHYSIDDQDKVPYEVYISDSTAAASTTSTKTN